MNRRGGILLEILVSIAIFVGAAAFTLGAARSVLDGVDRAERRRQEGVGDPLEAADMFRDLLQPAKRRMRETEAKTGRYTGLLMGFRYGVPDIESVLRFEGLSWG